MNELDALRAKVRQRYQQTEPEIVRELLAAQNLNDRERAMLADTAAGIVQALRDSNNPTIMESFLSEYGLSTREGVGLMCLAEALLRVPDADTVDELIADKVEPSNWGLHLGKSSSSLVNASTWALMLTGKLLDDVDENAPVVALRQLIRRVGEPVVRTAVSQAMKMLGKQFVLGQTIEEAIAEAATLEARGYTYSYDMLGEAARTHGDAVRYFEAYADAIAAIARADGSGITERPGISVKLSALYPRYETTHREAVMQHLLPRIQKLARLAAEADIGLNIDAEEADRLDLSLDLIESLMADEQTASWGGLGIVVQAYGRRALPVIDWLLAACQQYQRRIMVRLVKGAYWDAEIKQAQELGLANFPVFTRKAITDLSYLVCAQRLLAHREVIYPQFATHNAHTVAAVRYLAGTDTASYEFQRLHGMGESLHEHVLQQSGTRCRIYAPVGAHVDLLAYLVRRLLENGANSSFVNQIVNTDLTPQEVAACPVAEVEAIIDNIEHPSIVKPLHLFQPERMNSKGYRINDPASIQPLLEEREQYRATAYTAAPLKAIPTQQTVAQDVLSPAAADEVVGSVIEATVDDAASAITTARECFQPWQSSTAMDRAECLVTASNLYEAHMGELCALLTREAGKHLSDAISEVREAVDFLRYYAAESLDGEARAARGVIICISPWNFPLAIFTGQIAAALAAGNTVIAKPAQQTPLVAAKAVALLHQAAIPQNILQLLPGDGSTIGQALISDTRIDGVCFTGSTAVAKHIEKTLADRTTDDVKAGASVNPMLIAETGGLNAMIADTTALTEQVVRDVLISSFQSAGQRCSALRMLYVQEEAEDRLMQMLCGALETLNIGDPWPLSTDVGPIIDAAAKARIDDYILHRKVQGQLVMQLAVPESGHFVGPAIVRVSGIEELEEEIFGPVLHVATFKADQLDQTVDAINAKGYGLTFALHTRIDDRVQQVVERIRVGNVYVNRNQIGAVVGSQPFGGEGKSGTGPKAGGPNYLDQFYQPFAAAVPGIDSSLVQSGARVISKSALIAAADSVRPFERPLSIDDQSELAALQMIASRFDCSLTSMETDWLLPGPTGESNRLTLVPHGTVLVLARELQTAMQLAVDALIAGCAVVLVTPEAPDDMPDVAGDRGLPLTVLGGRVDAEVLSPSLPFDAMAVALCDADYLHYKQALAVQFDHVFPVVDSVCTPVRFTVERHVCIDTTAAGGNATLLASAE
jgi:RHH-type proline utilization regulon transcriptional repressor/proline dehydrogenase/delta 1-pyrroline-5-carboxylate dehydrogenase